MGFKRIVKGIGKGSLFGHGRAFGVHKLWDTDLGKAIDPFIDINVLARLSYTDSGSVRTAIIQNIRQRVSDDLEADSLKKFPKSMLRHLLDIDTPFNGETPNHQRITARLISLTTPKSKKVIDAPATEHGGYETRSVERYDGSYMLLGYEEEEVYVTRHIPERVHYEYDDLDVLKVCLRHNFQTKAGARLLDELSTENPELGEKIRDIIRDFTNLDEKAVQYIASALRGSEKLDEKYAVSALIQVGKPAVPTLIEVLGDTSIRVREVVVKALGEIGDRGAVPVLIEALENDSLYGRTHVRTAAAEALGKIKDGSAIHPLINALEDTWRDSFYRFPVRDAALTALRELGEPAFKALIEALNEKDSERRCLVAWALGKMGDRRAVPALVEALREDLPMPDANDYGRASIIRTHVRTAAAEALGNLKDPMAVPCLKDALDGTGYEVIRAAREALKKIEDLR